MIQLCPGLRRGLTYEVVLRYRGGPVELKVYEYDAKGSLKTDRAFARGEPTPARTGGWGTVRGAYRLPQGMSKATLAVTVPAGAEADVDAVSLEEIEQAEGFLNVRDFGASGSEFETLASTTPGARTVALAEAGDFEVGQEVAISRCNPHIADIKAWSIARRLGTADVKEQLQARGYDGSLGSWTVYLLDFPGANPPTFRWSDDLGLTWQGEGTAATEDWQALSGGVEVRFPTPAFWRIPTVISFGGRDQLISTITEVKGDQLTLADATPLGVEGCTVQHTDSRPLQLAFDRAVSQGRNVFIPPGRYRLTRGLTLRNADGIQVEGANEETTVLDIGNGTGACISIVGGTSVTLRNLRFRGFSGFAERRQMGSMRTQGYPHMWGFFAKHCNAVGIRTPERVLVENCHATGMSAECFYSSSRSRRGNTDPERYTKSIVYRNCTVVDCARNAFNNNDHAENTAVLYCRIQDVGGCSWEGASRFVKIVGNYIRNAGTVAIGNTRSRHEAYDVLPIGQHIVAHNTFEQEMVYGGCAVRTSGGATPVIISNNIFVNFNTSAIEASSYGDDRHLPSANTIVTGNAIDLTCVRDRSKPRFGIRMDADDATVSDNQIIVRGEPDPMVKGIILTEPGRNMVVHDNTVRGCAVGLSAGKKTGRITEVLDKRSFRCDRGMTWPRRRSHAYRGYRVVWVHRGRPDPDIGPEVEAFDPDEGVFRLVADADLTEGSRFMLLAPQGFHWSIHHNVIESCTKLVDLDVFGGPTAVFADNILARGQVTGGEAGVWVGGLFRICDNQFAGFSDSAVPALVVSPDPLNRKGLLVCRDNSFSDCAVPIGETVAGVWDRAITGGNIVGDQVEGDGFRISAVHISAGGGDGTKAPTCTAARVTKAPTIDGEVTDWDWRGNPATITLSRTHEGAASGAFRGRASLAYDAAALYLAIDVTLPTGFEFDPQSGVEWSFASADKALSTPIFVLSGRCDGSFESLTAMGADTQQAATLAGGTRYAVTASETGWTCEWRIAWESLGVSPAALPGAWLMNIGVHLAGNPVWLVWTPTGGRVCDVESAGILRLQE
ncbi:MAG: hypothetical protein HON70_01015 [Lentisphaerae bacterium]|nr:hypothetical protein [Lentisphaerota bacterium]